jgi:CRISPR-associated Csx10 family RAMP protein
LRLEIRVTGSLLVGGVSPPSLISDRATARTKTGEPYLPASALKGLIRHSLGRLLAGAGITCCAGAGPELTCSGDDPCPVCRLFGRPGQEGKVKFSDAHLAPNQAGMGSLFSEGGPGAPNRPTGLGYTMRPGLAVFRKTGTALEDHLFFFESTALPGEELLFTADLTVLAELAPEEETWLKAAAAAVLAVGAGKTRGLGAARMAIISHPRESEKEPGRAGVEEGPKAAESAGAEGLAARKRNPKPVSVTLILDPREPIRLTPEKSAGRFYETLDYVPGGVVRGAAAAAVARHFGPEARRELFLQRPLSFSNLYPARDPQPWPIPVPLTSRRCRVEPPGTRGLRTAGGHGVYDVALTEIVADALSEALGGDRGDLGARDVCPRCQGPLRPLPGGYLSVGPETGPERGVVTKAAIDRRVGTVLEGALYSYSWLDPDTGNDESRRLKYFGMVTAGCEEDLANLRQALGGGLTIGGSRSRGFGSCRALLGQPEGQAAGEVAGKTAKDVVYFNGALGRLARTALKVLGPGVVGAEANGSAPGAPSAQRLLQLAALAEWAGPTEDGTPATNEAGGLSPARVYASLTLTSHLILPSWDAPREEVERLLPEGSTIERLYVRSTRVGGWNAALGIEKDLTPAIVMGSVIVFSLSGRSRKDMTETLVTWASERSGGLALRTAEGFGRFSLCHPFHAAHPLPISGGENSANRNAG